MKRCTNCKWAEWKRTANGRLHPSGEGRCAFPYKVPPLPAAFGWIGRLTPVPSGGHIERKRELKEHCPYFARREGE
jgi:hypothetical protein